MTEATYNLSVSVQYTPELGHRPTIRIAENDLSKNARLAYLHPGSAPYQHIESHIIRQCRDRYGVALQAAYQKTHHWYGIGSVQLNPEDLATLPLDTAA
jgi:hypothetical protein